MHYEPQQHNGLSSARNIDRINAEMEAEDEQTDRERARVRALILAESDEIEQVELLSRFGATGETWAINFADKYTATADYSFGEIVEIYDIEEV